jgi:hypothetical protein
MNLVRYALRGRPRWTRSARSQGYQRAHFIGAARLADAYYEIVINVLLRKGRSTLIGRMASKINLASGPALAAAAFCCLVESSFGQDAYPQSFDRIENDDRNGEDKDDEDDKSNILRTRSTGSVVGRFVILPNESCLRCHGTTTAGSNISFNAGSKICSVGL